MIDFKGFLAQVVFNIGKSGLQVLKLSILPGGQLVHLLELSSTQEVQRFVVSTQLLDIFCHFSFFCENALSLPADLFEQFHVLFNHVAYVFSY